MLKVSLDNKKMKKLHAASVGIPAYAASVADILEAIKRLPYEMQAATLETFRVEGKGNLALIDNELHFMTCPCAKACAAICYARQGAYTWKTTKQARLFNLALSFSPCFEAIAIQAIKRKRAKLVRVHDSGDMYNARYFKAWLNIARAIPEKLFYTYTKSLNLIQWESLPENFKLVQSMGGTLDHSIDESKPLARIFASKEAREKAGFIDGNENDRPAIEGKRRIGLVYHGTRKLTMAQASYFDK